MTTEILMRFICIVCHRTFLSYVKCQLNRRYEHDKVLDIKKTIIELFTFEFGVFNGEYFTENYNQQNNIFWNKPIPDKRKCKQCSKASQLESYM